MSLVEIICRSTQHTAIMCPLLICAHLYVSSKFQLYPLVWYKSSGWLKVLYWKGPQLLLLLYTPRLSVIMLRNIYWEHSDASNNTFTQLRSQQDSQEISGQQAEKQMCVYVYVCIYRYMSFIFVMRAISSQKILVFLKPFHSCRHFMSLSTSNVF